MYENGTLRMSERYGLSLHFHFNQHTALQVFTHLIDYYNYAIFSRAYWSRTMVYLTIIPRARVEYEMVDSLHAGYNHLMHHPVSILLNKPERKAKKKGLPLFACQRWRPSKLFVTSRTE